MIGTSTPPGPGLPTPSPTSLPRLAPLPLLSILLLLIPAVEPCELVGRWTVSFALWLARVLGRLSPRGPILVRRIFSTWARSSTLKVCRPAWAADWPPAIRCPASLVPEPHAGAYGNLPLRTNAICVLVIVCNASIAEFSIWITSDSSITLWKTSPTRRRKSFLGIKYLLSF